ncbi:MAG: chorismate mutase [Alphaproteobacteria bacterium]|nr:chorismate mutase [Alphaproteobacteria bacterium]
MNQAAAPSLDDLRRRIDAIDDGLLDLIHERTTIVEAIAAAKRASGNAAAFRPGREAAVMRRLAARHKGRFGLATVVRLWREIMCEFTRLQGPFAVAVHVTPEAPGRWDLARDHFGSQTPMAIHQTPVQVIHAVNDGSATVGVLPPPSDEADGMWWTSLLADEPGGPRIIARLPFASAGNARGTGLQAVAIGKLPTEPSGRDRSYLAIDMADDTSLGATQRRLHDAGLPLRGLVGVDQPRLGIVHLAEIDDYLADDDPRLARFRELSARRLRGLKVLGAYAVPLAEGPAA